MKPGSGVLVARDVVAALAGWVLKCGGFMAWGRTILSIHAFVVFLLAGILVNLTPGTDTSYVLGRSLAQGRKAGVASVMGLVWFASRIGDRLRGSAGFAVVLNRTVGVLLVVLDLRLAVAK